jgi:2,3-bisphosphoglycerate-dependent phosphoglycerate mutase
MPEMVLIRHGKSLWNSEGRFTGWVDIDLTEEGMAEAKDAGRLLKDCGYSFDVAYTSYLKRAIRTLWIVLEEMNQMWIPILPSWRLNERNYGALQGCSKTETEDRFGIYQVQRWRRGFSDRPPAMSQVDEGFHGNDPRYKTLAPGEVPKSESLKDTLERFLPLWQERILPDLIQGKRILISSHGNTIRAIIKYIDKLSDREIEDVEVPTGVPLVYILNDDLKPTERFYLKGERCKEGHQ